MPWKYPYPSLRRLRLVISHDPDLQMGFLIYQRIGQVIAPLLIIQRIANKSALMSNTLSPGGIEEFEARSRGESTAGAVPRRFPVSLIGGVRVDTTVDYHQDKA